MWRLVGLIGLVLAALGVVVLVLGLVMLSSTLGGALLAAGAAGGSGGVVLLAISRVLKELETLAARLDGVALPAAAAVSMPAPAFEPAPAFAQPPAPTFAAREEELEDEPEEPPAPVVPPPPPPPLRQAPEPVSGRPSFPPFVRPRPPEPLESGSVPAADLRRGRILSRPGEGEQPAARVRPPMEPAPAPEAPAPAVPASERFVTERPAARPFVSSQTAIARPQPPAPAPVSRSEPRSEPPEPTILKSGVVGGMAYTLYSDGSIQAELPDGVLRFASLQELRDHVARAAQQGR